MLDSTGYTHKTGKSSPQNYGPWAPTLSPIKWALRRLPHCPQHRIHSSPGKCSLSPHCSESQGNPGALHLPGGLHKTSDYTDLPRSLLNISYRSNDPLVTINYSSPSGPEPGRSRAATRLGPILTSTPPGSSQQSLLPPLPPSRVLLSSHL